MIHKMQCHHYPDGFDGKACEIKIEENPPHRHEGEELDAYVRRVFPAAQKGDLIMLLTDVRDFQPWQFRFPFMTQAEEAAALRKLHAMRHGRRAQ